MSSYAPTEEGLVSREVLAHSEHRVVIRETWDLRARNLPFAWCGPRPGTYWTRDLIFTPETYERLFGKVRVSPEETDAQ